MKRLLFLLLISTIAYAIIEDPDEYDDVSLEIPGSGILKGVGKAIGKVKLPKIKLNPTFNRIKNEVINKYKSNWQRIFNRKINPVIKNVKQKIKTKIEKPIVRVITPKVKQIEKKVVIPLERRLFSPTIKRINAFLNKHPKLKKISDPFIKELKKIDPKKSIKEILADPQNAGKIINKTLKPFIDKVKAKHPFKIIKGKIKEFENFLEKNKIPVKKITSLFKKVSDKGKQALNQLSQRGRNTIYWLKKKGYWEPIKFVIETGGQYAAESLCSLYLTPLVCGPVVEVAFTFGVNRYLDSL